MQLKSVKLSVTPVSNKRSRAPLWGTEPPITGLYTRLCLKISCLMVSGQGWATGCTVYIVIISPPCVSCGLYGYRVSIAPAGSISVWKGGRKKGENVLLSFYWKKKVRHERSCSYILYIMYIHIDIDGDL